MTKKNEISSIITNSHSMKDCIESVNKYLISKELFIIDKIMSTLDKRCESYSRTISMLSEMRAEVING